MKSYPVTLTISETGETIQKKFELGEGETNVEDLLDAVRAARLCPLGNNLRLVNQENVATSLHKLGDNAKLGPFLGQVALVQNEDGEWDLCTIRPGKDLPGSRPAFEYPLNAYHQAAGVELQTKTEINYLDFVAGGKKMRFVLPQPNYEDAESSDDEDTPEIVYEKGVDIIHLDSHHPTIDDLKEKVCSRHQSLFINNAEAAVSRAHPSCLMFYCYKDRSSLW